jgi:hypothetical protein
MGYIAPAFMDKLVVHITKNFLTLPNIKVPLILGIWAIKFPILDRTTKNSVISTTLNDLSNWSRLSRFFSKLSNPLDPLSPVEKARRKS